MEIESGEPVKIFYCYAREDQILRDELEKHLTPLKRSGKIVTWCDREILLGTEWESKSSWANPSCLQEVPDDTAKFFWFLSLWPMPAFLHDIEFCVWDECCGPLCVGERDGCVLRTMYNERWYVDFV